MLRKTKQQIAHTSMIPSLGNRDLRSLQDIINLEKSFVKSNSATAQAWQASSEAFKTWGDGEGEDLNDIMSKASLLLDQYTAAQNRLNSHTSTLRLHFKSIRTREEGLADLKSRKRNLQSKIESVEKKLSKMGPENKELAKTTQLLREHRGEMETLRVDVLTEEASLGDFKRRTTKEAMGLKFGGLLEFSEKVTIIAEVGRMLIEEIPLDTTPVGGSRAVYNGQLRTDHLIQEARRNISEVGFVPGGASGGSRHQFQHMDNSLADDTFDSELARQDDEDDGAWRQDENVDAEKMSRYGSAQTNPSIVPEVSLPQGAEAGYEGYEEEPRRTPIYASRQTTQPWLRQPEADDTSLRSRQVSADHHGPPSGVHGSHQDEEPTPIAETAELERLSLQPGQVYRQGESPSHQHNGQEGLEDRSLGNASLSQGPPRLMTPPPVDHGGHHTPSSVSGNAPFLPPLRASSPLPNSGSGTANDDDSYFAAIGSTRAAQASARRPQSPGAPTSPGRYGAGPSLGAMGAATASSGYEPSESGRKTKASAFKSVFNRTSSGQQSAPAQSSLSAFNQPGGSGHGLSGFNDGGSSAAEGPASPPTAPLAIRKRNSAVIPDDYAVDQASGAGNLDMDEAHAGMHGDAELPLPPYAAAPRKTDQSSLIPTYPGAGGQGSENTHYSASDAYEADAYNTDGYGGYHQTPASSQQTQPPHAGYSYQPLMDAQPRYPSQLEARSLSRPASAVGGRPLPQPGSSQRNGY